MVNKLLITKIDVGVFAGVGLVLMIMYSVVLLHVYNGNRNKWLATVLVLLFLSNLGNVWVAYAYQMLFIK